MTSSVALCTYNGSRYLSAQLESIVCQTKNVDEIIICDDCSADNTLAIIESFIKRNDSIRFKIQKNKINLGFVKNFEQAISLCSGDIIFLSDQDDIWFPDKVETVCHYFEYHNDKDFIFSNAEMINDIGIKCYEQTLFEAIGWDNRNKDLFNKGYAYDVIGVSSRITGATVALRSSFIPYCIPFPKTWANAPHDEMMAVSAVLRNKIGYIDKCLIKYRLHANQTSGLAYLLKNPPKRIEKNAYTILWHEAIAKNDNNYGLDYLQMMYKRFWIRYKNFSFFRFLWMYLSGEYSEHYKDSFDIFLRDIKGIIIRVYNKLKKIRYYKFIYSKYY